MPVADSHRLPVIFVKNNKLKKCEDGNQGGDASFTLQVSESGPAVQYRYKQSRFTPEKVGEKAWEKGWRPSSTVPSNNCFTISGLEPVRVAGTLYVQVTIPRSAGLVAVRRTKNEIIVKSRGYGRHC